MSLEAKFRSYFIKVTQKKQTSLKRLKTWMWKIIFGIASKFMIFC